MSKIVNNRVNFASVKNPLPYPDFLDVQLKSFRDFLQLDTPPEKRKNDGLYKVFAENFPIADTRNNFVLEFLDYYIDAPRYSIEECLERGLTYSVPLKAKLKLYCSDPEHEDFDTVIQDVFLGPIPYMTDNGTFVINGAERVVVSQLHRSPGVFFGSSVHANGTPLFSARIIPFKGSWIEFATDINNVMYAYIDRKKKLPVTTLLRAIGFETDKDILRIFNLAEEVKVTKANLKKCLGRKLAARVLKSWNEDFVDEDTGEVVSIERNQVVIDRETVLEEEHIEEILESGVDNILVHQEDANVSDYSIIFNTLQKDPSNSEKEAVVYIYRQLRNADPADDASAREVINNLFFSEKRYDLGDVGRYRINKKLHLDTDPDVRVLTKEDIRNLFAAGADKVSINSEAVKNPNFIKDAANKFGSQAVIAAIDAKSNGDNSWEVVIAGGRKKTGLDAVNWAKTMEEFGAGEILLTSMDKDGMKTGYDIALTKAVSQAVTIPVIASGGVGTMEHFYEGFSLGLADAALAASVFHFQEMTIMEVKEYLKNKNIPVRI